MCTGIGGTVGASSAVLGNTTTGGILASGNSPGIAPGTTDGTDTGTTATTANSLLNPSASRFLLPNGFGQKSPVQAFDFASMFGGQSMVGGPSIFGNGNQSLQFTA